MIYGKVEFGRNFSSAKREEKLRPPPRVIQYIAMKIPSEARDFPRKKFLTIFENPICKLGLVLFWNFGLRKFAKVDLKIYQVLKCFNTYIILKKIVQVLENFSSFHIMVSILDHPQGLVEEFWLFISIV